MPCASGRGKTLGYRTIKPNPETYTHAAIKSKTGKRGGRTVAGKVHRLKPETKKKLKRLLASKRKSRFA